MISNELKDAIKKACGTHSQIAESYNVTKSQVGHIRSDKPRRKKDPREFAGAGNGNSKLKDWQVAAIIKELKEGVKGCVLARKYKISEAVISRIKHKKTWMDWTTEDGEYRHDGRQYA